MIDINKTYKTRGGLPVAITYDPSTGEVTANVERP